MRGPASYAGPGSLGGTESALRRSRRLIRDVSSVLMISGVLLVVDAGVTLLWQEPVTALIGLIKQGEINKQYPELQQPRP